MGDVQDTEGAAPTQLSDMRPQIDQPLRVAIPTNAPERVSKASTDAFIQMNTFSAQALSLYISTAVLYLEVPYFMVSAVSAVHGHILQ